MAHTFANRQATIQLDADELHIGAETYPLHDVLYADVVDIQDQQVRGFLRREDALLLVYMGIIVAIVMFLIFQFASAIGAFKGPTPGLIFFWWFGIGPLMRQIKKVNARRSQSPVTLRVHTRDESVEVVRTGNLLYAHFLAARINRAVKRDILA